MHDPSRAEITTARRRRRPWGRIRGTIAVVLLLLSALEALLSAATGFPPASWRIRKLSGPVRAMWQESAWERVPVVTSVIYVPASERSQGDGSTRR